MNLKEITKQRRTTKSYDPNKSIPNDVWEEIVDFGHNSPTSMNWQTWRAITINRTSEVFKKLSEEQFLFNFQKISESQKLVVFVTPGDKSLAKGGDFRRKRLVKGVKLRALKKGQELKDEDVTDEMIAQAGEFLDNGWGNYNNDWAAKQAYIGASFMVIAAAKHKVDTTMMEGYSAQGLKDVLVKENLMDETEEASLIVSFGYRKDETSIWPTERDPKEEKFTEIK